MTFIWPVMLFLLIVLPLLVVLYIVLQQQRRWMAERFGSTGTAGAAANRKLGLKRHIPSAIFLVALAILIVALARPQGTVSLPRLEGTVVLAFDVSGSMAADDLKPTRMEAAKAAAKEFVAKQPSSVMIGVVSFSDTGFTTQPPTNDQNAVLTAIDRLTVQKGTSVARGIEASLNVIQAATNPDLTLSVKDPNVEVPSPTPVPNGDYQPAVIVLLTDGENNQDPDPLEFAQMAEDRGIRIYTVGIGSTEGATLHMDGFTITSRLDEQSLQNISQLTGGTYYNAENEDQLNKIYDNLDPELIMRTQDIEVTALFAGAGILVMLLGGGLSLLWLGRIP